jgi:6-phosphogluconolactonase
MVAAQQSPRLFQRTSLQPFISEAFEMSSNTNPLTPEDAKTTSLVVCSSKEAVPIHLNAAIVRISAVALASRGIFSIALSGGSLASFLSTIKTCYDEAGIDPRFECWHVLLADERCVPLTDNDSNLGALKQSFLTTVSIPVNQIYGINESKISLGDSTSEIASDYEEVLSQVLLKCGGYLDLAILGFGPDGHACSLFPGHSLLREAVKLVGSIEDSPKPPLKRITFTIPMLNTKTRHVIVCGTGNAKGHVLEKIIKSIGPEDATYRVPNGKRCEFEIVSPSLLPCAMVQPNSGDSNTLCWIVDSDAVKGLPFANHL